MLVVALIYKESRFRHRCVSKKNYGLMQVRVSHTTHAALQGREHVLYIPRTNLTYGLRLLKFWQRYHERTCPNAKHFWTSHYQHGCRVSDSGSGDRVRALYEKLVTRFRSSRTSS